LDPEIVAEGVGTSFWVDIVAAGTVTVRCVAETALACVNEQCGVGALFAARVRGTDTVEVAVGSAVVGAIHGQIREPGTAAIVTADGGSMGAEATVDGNGLPGVGVLTAALKDCRGCGAGVPVAVGAGVEGKASGMTVGEGGTATDVIGMLSPNSRVALLLTTYGVAMGKGAGAVTVVGRIVDVGVLDDGGMVRGTVIRMARAGGNVEFAVCMFSTVMRLLKAKRARGTTSGV
jgi:hypothetical protein